MFIENKFGNMYIKTFLERREAPFNSKQLSPSGGFLREGLSRAREQSAFNDKAVVKQMVERLHQTGSEVSNRGAQK